MPDKPMTAKEYKECIAAWSAGQPSPPRLFVHQGPGALPGELYVGDDGQLRPYQGHPGFPWDAEAAQRVADFINQVYPRESGETAGALDALLVSFNSAALFTQYRNRDGSVTLTAAEAERVGAKVTAALKLAATRGFPWLVMLGDDQIVAGFFSEAAAAAYINLSREPGKYRLVGHPSVAHARASSVATMPNPASLTDQPRRGAKSPDRGVRNTAKNMSAPEGTDWDETLAKIRELSDQGRPGKLEPWRAAWLETLFAKLRGMEWVVVDSGFSYHEPHAFLVGTHRNYGDAEKAAIARSTYRVTPIDEVLEKFEQMDAEQQTG